MVCLVVTSIGCGRMASLDGRGCPCVAGYVCCENGCVLGRTCLDQGEPSDGSPSMRTDGAPAPGANRDGRPDTGSQADRPLDAASNRGDAESEAARYLDISVGKGHACVIRADGSVGCWGSNYANKSVPPQGIFRKVSSGFNSSCAIAGDGVIRCWGSCTTLPNDPCIWPTVGAFAQISGDSDDRCAVAETGAVSCWGPNGLPAPMGSF